MFSLKATSSVLSHNLLQHIDVSSGWELGDLFNRAKHNSILNIEREKNNKFYYSGGDSVISIPEGAYEMVDIGKVIQSKLPIGMVFSLKPNNILKGVLMCSLDVNFTKEHSLS